MKGNIGLRDEIYLEDAYKMADWLDNEDITKYLTEGSEISKEIRRTIKYMTCPIVTHLFCTGGNFYMITLDSRTIGYLKLVTKGKGCEVVIVIGDTNMWNHGFGTKALNLAMYEAFINLRYEFITAKIMFENASSRHLFEKQGFDYKQKGESCHILEMDLSQYLKKAA